MTLPPFQLLIDEHGNAVWRYLVGMLGPHDAADCYQETVLAALRGYPELRRGDNLRGWLFTIASRKVIDAHRSRRRVPVPVDELPEAGVPPREDDGSVWKAVRALPDGQRAAVAQRFLADLSYAEIGAVLGCSEAAARQRVHDALLALRKVMA